MKRILLLVFLVLPLAAFGDQVDFGNSGGNLTGSNAGLSLGGSTITTITGLGGGTLTGSSLGTVSFSTGSLASGSLQMGGTFNAGGSFMITGSGLSGAPSGVIFNGSFSGPVTWTLIQLSNGRNEYLLSGTISGTWENTGITVSGATFAMTVQLRPGAYFNGKARLASGDTNILAPVPEPGTLGLLGTGLIGLAGMLNRKLKAS
jgi:hypothetical protein